MGEVSTPVTSKRPRGPAELAEEGAGAAADVAETGPGAVSRERSEAIDDAHDDPLACDVPPVVFFELGDLLVDNGFHRSDGIRVRREGLLNAGPPSATRRAS